jgi:hypothetical protein
MGLCSPTECNKSLSRLWCKPHMPRGTRNPLAKDCLPQSFVPYSVSPHRAAASVHGTPTSHAPASSGFHNLMTPSSAPSLLALFHARSTHGVSPSEHSSFPAAGFAVSDSPYPHDVDNLAAYGAKLSRGSVTAATTRPPRLQGLHPRESPPLCNDGLGRHRACSSLEVSPLQGVHPSNLGSDSRLCLPSFGWKNGRRIDRSPSTPGSHSVAWLAGLSRDCRPS